MSSCTEHSATTVYATGGLLSRVITFSLNSPVDGNVLRAEDVDPLDAPDYLPAGSTIFGNSAPVISAFHR